MGLKKVSRLGLELFEGVGSLKTGNFDSDACPDIIFKVGVNRFALPLNATLAFREFSIAMTWL